MKYTFRIIAVNKGGQSKPSEPSDPIVAKDRNGKFVVIYYCMDFAIYNL